MGAAGELYLVSRTSSTNFQVTPGAIQTNLRGGNDAFIVKLTPTARTSARLNAGQIELGLHGELGGRYTIQTSANLGNWGSWTNIGTTGSMVWMPDPQGPRPARRFYRALADESP